MLRPSLGGWSMGKYRAWKKEIGNPEGHLSIKRGSQLLESRFKPKSPTSIIWCSSHTLKSGLVNGWMWTLQRKKIKDDSEKVVLLSQLRISEVVLGAPWWEGLALLREEEWSLRKVICLHQGVSFGQPSWLKSSHIRRKGLLECSAQACAASMEPTGTKDIFGTIRLFVMSKACEWIRVKSAAENRMVCTRCNKNGSVSFVGHKAHYFGNFCTSKSKILLLKHTSGSLVEISYCHGKSNKVRRSTQARYDPIRAGR